ncbi:alpha-E domain-containing protein [Paenibacillaceae bacterium]|nr:alpha-E domain-containing protein [Paenibacillaceae bacterium]
MLNRNAEALFWVGRYMERAENHARLIDVHYHLQHEDSKLSASIADTDGIGKWGAIVEALGSMPAYERHYEQYSELNVLKYVTLDRDHPNSLVACVNHARGNLRTLREKVPSELWDVVNAFYLWLRDKKPEDWIQESPHHFFQRIKEWAALFQGIAQSVMPRENEWHFIECGRYLERAENTLRILRSASGVFPEEEGGASAYPYLQAVLKSVSGYQAFRRYYADGMSVAAIIEFLVLHPAFPRSLHFSLQALDDHLQGIAFQDAQLKAAHTKIIRQTSKLIAEVSCLEREELLLDTDGFLITDLLASCQQLGHGFAQTFFRRGEASA